MKRSTRAGAGGFTLIEVLVAVAVLGLLAVAMGAISVTAVNAMSRDSQDRHLDATTSQWISTRFAKDVQGASSVTLPGACSSGVAGATLLVTLSASEGSDTTGWLYEGGRLYRSPCDGTADLIVEDLGGTPTVTRTPSNSDTPRQVRLQVTRPNGFTVAFDGARRLRDYGGGTVVTDAPQLFALGGTTPLVVSGSSQLQITGNAYVNKNSSGDAVKVNGSGLKLSVTGQFGIQDYGEAGGGTCTGCSGSVTPYPPVAFDGALPDPFRFLPAPDPGTTIQTACPEGPDGIQVCQPGIYPDTFPPKAAPDAAPADTYVLQPGVYTLRSGIKITGGSVTGSGVLLFNEVGAVDVTGGTLDLEPPTTGAYRDILLFQARSNLDAVKINGNAVVATLSGILYAPSSTDVVLGSGGGTFRVGSVVGQNLEIAGSGTVIVNGS